MRLLKTYAFSMLFVGSVIAVSIGVSADPGHWSTVFYFFPMGITASIIADHLWPREEK